MPSWLTKWLVVAVVLAGVIPAQAAADPDVQLVASAEGIEAVPSADGRAAVVTEFNASSGIAVGLWRSGHPGLVPIAHQAAIGSQLVGLAASADGAKVAYRCGSSTVCLWSAGHGVVQRVRLACAALAKGAEPGRAYVSADLQTIAVQCVVAGRFTSSGNPTELPLILRRGRALPTKRLRGYLPLGVSDDGAVILGQPSPKPTVVYAGGHLHPLPWPSNIFSPNGRYFVGPHGNTDRTITVYDRITGHSRSWTPPPGPLEQSGADPNLVPLGSNSVSAVSDDGSRLIYDDEVGTLYLGDLRSGALTTLATDVTRAFRSLSADGRTVFYEQHRHPSDLIVQQLGATSAARVKPPSAKSSAAAPGVSLTGSLTNLTLCTPYVYKVSVVSSRPHREAVIAFVAYGANDPKQQKTVNLVAGRKWTGTFTEYFGRPADMSKGLQVVVMVQPPHRVYTALFRHSYAITAAPGQGEASRPPGSCGPVAPWFGS